MNDEREKRKRPPRGAAFCVCLAERGTAATLPNGTQSNPTPKNFSTGLSGLATPGRQLIPTNPKGSKR